MKTLLGIIIGVLLVIGVIIGIKHYKTETWKQEHKYVTIENDDGSKTNISIDSDGITATQEKSLADQIKDLF